MPRQPAVKTCRLPTRLFAQWSPFTQKHAYIRNLKRAGIEAKLDIYLGLFHAFDILLPFRKVSRRAAACLGHYFAKQRGENGNEHTEDRR